MLFNRTAVVRARLATARAIGPYIAWAADQVRKRGEARVRRTALVQRYARGAGLEIGAAAGPSIVPVGATVTYVDKYPLEVIAADPELAGLQVQAPDIVTDGETLDKIADESQSFVLAFSMMEHAQSPITMLENVVRVLRPGGYVVVSVPDKRYYAPDRERPLTTFEHLVRDYEEGPATSLDEHLWESAKMHHGLQDAKLEAFVAKLKANDGHTHFHVWSAPSYLSFLQKAADYLGLPTELVEFASYGHEALAVLRKDAAV